MKTKQSSGQKMYALVSNQGTAMDETSFCSDCIEKNRGLTQDTAPKDAAIPLDWHECTDNDALVCNNCGWPESGGQKFTPGPVRGDWRVRITGKHPFRSVQIVTGIEEATSVVADLLSQWKPDVVEVHARLMAAAPKQHEALKAVLAHFDAKEEWTGEEHDLYHQVVLPAIQAAAGEEG